MSIASKFTAATAAALIASTGIAAAADAPIVSKQHTSTAKSAPIEIPGTGLQKGDRLPSGARLVYRNVTLEGDQTATFNIKPLTGRAVDTGDAVPRGTAVVTARARPRRGAAGRRAA